MALAFSSTARVGVGTPLGASPTVFSQLVWIYPTSITSTVFPRVTAQGDPSGFMHLVAPGKFGSGQIQCAIEYTPTTAVARTNDAALSVDTWQCVGFTFDGVTAPNFYTGTLDSAMANISSGVGYAVQTAPGGTRTSDGGDSFFIGNDEAGTLPFPGRIAVVAVWDRVLSLTELRQAQRGHFFSGTGLKLLMFPGYDGTGTQTDFSGQVNHGTISGTPTVVAHVPLVNPFAWHQEGDAYEVAAAGLSIPVAYHHYQNQGCI